MRRGCSDGVTGLAVAKDGTVFVVDTHNNCLKRIAGGEVSNVKLALAPTPGTSLSVLCFPFLTLSHSNTTEPLFSPSF